MSKNPLDPLTLLRVPVGIGASVEIKVHELGGVYVKGGSSIEVTHPIGNSSAGLVLSSSAQQDCDNPEVLAKVRVCLSGMSGMIRGSNFLIQLRAAGNNLVFDLLRGGGDQTKMEDILSVQIPLEDH